MTTLTDGNPDIFLVGVMESDAIGLDLRTHMIPGIGAQGG
jgi:hypothetical protein